MVSEAWVSEASCLQRLHRHRPLRRHIAKLETRRSHIVTVVGAPAATTAAPSVAVYVLVALVARLWFRQV